MIGTIVGLLKESLYFAGSLASIIALVLKLRK